MSCLYYRHLAATLIGPLRGHSRPCLNVLSPPQFAARSPETPAQHFENSCFRIDTSPVSVRARPETWKLVARHSL
jgi:hypothetical protein